MERKKRKVAFFLRVKNSQERKEGENKGRGKRENKEGGGSQERTKDKGEQRTKGNKGQRGTKGELSEENKGRVLSLFSLLRVFHSQEKSPLPLFTLPPFSPSFLS